MTTGEMVTLTESFLATHLHSYWGDGITTANKVATLNWAQRTVSKKIRFFKSSLPLTLVASTGTYNSYTVASRPLIRPHRAYINGTPLRDANGRDYGVWAFSELERMHPRWRSEGDGVPTVVAWLKQELIVFPPPTAQVVSDGNNFITAECLAADLDPLELNDPCELPTEAHEAVCLLAAVRHASPTLSEEYAWSMVGRFDAMALAECDRLEQETANALLAWGSTPAHQSEYMWA